MSRGIQISRITHRAASILIFGLALFTPFSPPLAAPLPPPPPDPEHRPAVILSLGEQRWISLPGLVRYSLGAPMLRILPSPGGRKDVLLAKAVKPGITDLWVWKKDGSTERRSIEVRDWKRGRVGELENRLGDLKELEVWVVGDPEKGKAKYLIQGTVTGEAEAKRVGRLLEAFPERVESNAVLSDGLFLPTVKKLEAWIARSKWREDLELVADPENRSIAVRGGLPDPGSKSEIVRSLRGIAPLARLEIDAMPDRNPTIHFKVFLLELRKNKSRSLGLDFPGIIPNALRISSIGIHSALSIEAAIHALENEGAARVLSQPELVVRAPGEAELFAGGEVPIQSRTVYSSKVEWRAHGLTLKLKVHAASGRRVRADIHTEVSHLDGKIGPDEIPGLQANRMKTQVDATFGQPLLLSGLLQEGVKRAARGLPYLKDIPVLGQLFGSRDYLENRSELVAILLPSRNVPAAPTISAGIERPTGNVPLPRDWLSPQEEIALRASPDFPWNAFADSADAEGAAFSLPEEFEDEVQP